ncbi:MAG: hypothetical protein K5866_05055 [Treponema sp.]|nr:hypothetical protein [Treponema sp.]
MKNALSKEFNDLLDSEDTILDTLIQKQVCLRAAVTEKKWNDLVRVTQEINEISEIFQEKDKRREEIQMTLSKEEIKDFFEKLGKVRSKLLKCKIENRVLGDYVNIARNFIMEVMENGLTQSRNKNYTREGKLESVQPRSVVLNQLY